MPKASSGGARLVPTAARLRARSMLVLLALLTALPSLALPPAARAQATEMVVTSTLDRPDADVVDHICDADPGPATRCTLALGPFGSALPLVAR